MGTRNAKDYDFELNPLDQTTTMVESVQSGHDAALVDDLPIIAYGIQQGSGLESVSEPEQTGDYGLVDLWTHIPNGPKNGVRPGQISPLISGLSNKMLDAFEVFGLIRGGSVLDYCSVKAHELVFTLTVLCRLPNEPQW